MSEKHPDRTSEWEKQKQALKNPKTIPVPSAKPPNETKDDKKENH